MPLAHKIGAALALVPFFVGALVYLNWGPVPNSDGITAWQAALFWVAVSIGVYCTVRAISFVINGRWN